MALKFSPGTTLPPQHSGIAVLPPAVVISAIDCTEIPVLALAQELPSITSVPGNVPTLSD